MNLTKSLFLSSLDCPRKLWKSSRSELPEPSLMDKHRFKQGYAFQEFVVSTLDIPIILGNCSQEQNLERTQDALKIGKPLVEAGFFYDGIYVRCDILLPNSDGYDLVEVKASNDVKKEHIPDLAIQLYVLEKLGVKIQKVLVYHTNKEYVRNGDLTSDLIKIDEVTEDVRAYDDLPQLISEAKTVLDQESAPEIIMGTWCTKCPLRQECSSLHLPEHPVTELTVWQRYWKLYNQGILAIKDVPDDFNFNEKDKVIHQAVLENREVVQKEHLKYFLNTITYPIYHFDFETFDLAIPLFDNSRPWQKIPFQFSCHIEHEDGTIEHHEFLGEPGVDPRPKMLEAMKKLFSILQSTVMVYHQQFEIDRFKEFARDYPEHADWIRIVLDQIVDLEFPFKKYYFYNPIQCGKSSIKKVLPALTEFSYGDLDVQNGGDASMLYYYSHFDKELEQDRNKIRSNLLTYCELDTLAEVEVLKALKKLT